MDYDGRYGAGTGGGATTEKFIEAVYKSLKSPPQASS
jgi:hypothetical protein